MDCEGGTEGVREADEPREGDTARERGRAGVLRHKASYAREPRPSPEGVGERLGVTCQPVTCSP